MSNELAPVKQTGRLPIKRLGITDARKILQQTVAIPEEHINDDNKFQMLQLLDQKIRHAVGIVSEDILLPRGAMQYNPRILSDQKYDTQQAQMRLDYLIEDFSGSMDRPQVLLTYKEGNRSKFNDCLIPLSPDQLWVGNQAFRFTDWLRHGGGILIQSVFDINPELKLTDFHRIWRGVRWFSANILNWDGPMIMPEDFGTLEGYMKILHTPQRHLKTN